MSSSIFAIIAVVLFSGLGVFQLLLALGLPLGKYAYGGKYEKLPNNMRISSIIAIGIFIFGSILVLERAALISVFADPNIARIGVWVYAGYLALNTLMNLMSKSRKEKLVMTPLSLLLSVCCFAIAFLAM